MHQHLCWPQRNFPTPQRFAGLVLLAMQLWPGTHCSCRLTSLAHFTISCPPHLIGCKGKYGNRIFSFHLPHDRVLSNPTKQLNTIHGWNKRDQTHIQVNYDVSKPGKPLVSSFSQGSQLSVPLKHFLSSCNIWLFWATADGWLHLYCFLSMWDNWFKKPKVLYYFCSISFTDTSMCHLRLICIYLSWLSFVSWW